MSTDINKYIKDTEHNILLNDRSVDGTFAFATDTGKLFLSDNNRWVVWEPKSKQSRFEYPGLDLVLDSQPLVLIDATDMSTMYNNTNTRLSDLDATESQVARIDNLVTCKHNLQQPTFIQQPTCVKNLFGNLPGIRFDNKQTLFSQTGSTRDTGSFTLMLVMRNHTIHETWNTPRADVSLQSRRGICGDYNYRSITTGKTFGLAVYEQPTYIRYHLNGGNINSDSNAHTISSGSDDDLNDVGIDPHNDPLIITLIGDGNTRLEKQTMSHMSINGGLFGGQKVFPEGDFFELTSFALGTGARAGSTTYSGGLDVGYCVLFNDVLTPNQLNILGSHLADKFNTTWKNF